MAGIKNDSPEWKMYDDLARYSVRLLEENGIVSWITPVCE